MSEGGEVAEGVAVPGKLRGRDIYTKPRAFYAELYATSVRGINLWIKHGLSLTPEPIPPPLDDPANFISWWGAHMKHRVPERLLSVASKQAPPQVPCGTNEVLPNLESGATSETADDLFAQAPGATASRIDYGPIDEGAPLETGFLASLLRTRNEEARAHRAYHAATTEVPLDEGKIRILMRSWKDLAEHLRSLEKAAPDVLQQSGDMWLAVDIVKELEQIHGVIINGVEAMWRRFSVKIGIESDPVKDRLWQEECHRLFQTLLESKFVAHDKSAS